jgi:hypothetical protein
MKAMSKHPLFLSGGLTEYRIIHDGSLWRVTTYRGGHIAENLKGGWTSIVECQMALEAHLRRKDKFNRAIYPNAQGVNK